MRTEIEKGRFIVDAMNGKFTELEILDEIRSVVGGTSMNAITDFLNSKGITDSDFEKYSILVMKKDIINILDLLYKYEST